MSIERARTLEATTMALSRTQEPLFVASLHIKPEFMDEDCIRTTKKFCTKPPSTHKEKNELVQLLAKKRSNSPGALHPYYVSNK